MTFAHLRTALGASRRIYDAVTVLEGIGAIEREGKSNIAITPVGIEVMKSLKLNAEPFGGGSTAAQENDAAGNAIAETDRLKAELQQLEMELSLVQNSSRTLLSDADLYLTHKDVLRVFPNKKVFAVKAPGGTEIAVHDELESGVGKWEMSLTTRSAEDEVVIMEIVERGRS